MCCLCLLIFTVMCIPMGLYFSTFGAAYRVVHGNHMDRIAEGIPEGLEAEAPPAPVVVSEGFADSVRRQVPVVNRDARHASAAALRLAMANSTSRLSERHKKLAQHYASAGSLAQRMRSSPAAASNLQAAAAAARNKIRRSTEDRALDGVACSHPSRRNTSAAYEVERPPHASEGIPVVRTSPSAPAPPWPRAARATARANPRTRRPSHAPRATRRAPRALAGAAA